MLENGYSAEGFGLRSRSFPFPDALLSVQQNQMGPWRKAGGNVWQKTIQLTDDPAAQWGCNPTEVLPDAYIGRRLSSVSVQLLSLDQVVAAPSQTRQQCPSKLLCL